MIGQVFKYCAGDSLRRAPVLGLQALVSLVVTGFALVIALFWITGIAYHERCTHAFNWDYMVSGPIDGTLAQGLEAVAASGSGACALAIMSGGIQYPGVGGADDVTINTTFVLGQDWPIDVLSSPDLVIEGDPYHGEGAIIDSTIAERAGLRVGDSLFVFEGDPKEFVVTIDAIVANHYPLDGLCCRMPEAVAALFQEEQGFRATVAYLFDIDERDASAVETRLTELGDAESLSGPYLGSTMRKMMLDEYHNSLSRDYRSAISNVVIAVILILGFSLLDAFQKRRRRLRSFAIMVALGVSRGSVVVANTLETLLWQLIQGIAAFGFGMWWYGQWYGGRWMPPQVLVGAACVVIGTYLLASVVQIVMLSRAIRSKRLLGLLAAEGE